MKVMNFPPKRSQKPAPKPAPKAAAVAGLIAFGLLLGLGLIWLLLRVFPGLEPGGTRFIFTVLDGDTFRHQPGLVRPPDANAMLEDVTRFDDADGFRRPARVAERYAIAAIGDSFTDGGQVPWTDVLAESLDAPVRNMGWSGFGPLEYARIARDYLQDGTEWVLISYFEGNDLSNTATSFQRAQENGGDLPFSLERNVAPPILDVRAAAEYGDIVLNPDGWYLYPLDHPALGGAQIAYISDYLWWLNGDRATYAESRNAAELRAALDAIRESADGACVALVYAPTKEHIYFPYSDPGGNRIYVMQNARALVLREDGWLDFTPPAPQDWTLLEARLDNQRDVIAEIANAAGLRFFDLIPAFEAAAGSGELAYFDYDSHWNQRGHEIAGEAVADYLRAASCP
jgi:hypothetical protein